MPDPPAHAGSAVTFSLPEAALTTTLVMRITRGAGQTDDSTVARAITLHADYESADSYTVSFTIMIDRLPHVCPSAKCTVPDATGT